MVKRPSIPILGFYIIGIIASKYLSSHLRIILFILFLLFYSIILNMLSKVLFKQQSKKVYDPLFLAMPVFLMLGSILPGYYKEHNKLPTSMQNQIGQVQGTVSNVIPKSSYQEVYLEDVQVVFGKKILTMGQLLVQDKSDIPFTIGDQLIVEGKLEEFDRATNPGQFDSKLFYEAKGIYYRIWDGDILQRRKSKNLYYCMLNYVKSRVSCIYQKTLPKEDSDVLHAMVLGDKSELSTELKSLYQKGGISHILAISGLHISMIGMFLFKLLKKAGFHHNMASFLCMLLIWFYGRMTGLSVSTNRAVVMMILSLAACFVNRSYDSCSAIACSAILILIQQPYQLFQCGFQMSFLAVVGVVVFYPMCKEYMKWCFPDFQKKMHVKEQSEYYSFWVLLNRVTRTFRSSLLASASIQLFTLPVMLWFYYEIAPYAPILNLLVIPLASLLLLLAILLAVVGWFSIPLAAFLGGGIHCILWFYQFLCQLFQLFPHSEVVVGKPEPWQVIVSIFAVVLFGYFVKFRIHKAAGILLIIACMVIMLRMPVRELEITMLDVGQGDCIFMENEEGTTILIDGGSSDTKQVGTYRIHPFLKYSGIRVLDYCFLTHLDEDHISGILELLDYARENQDFVLKNLVLTYSEVKEEKGQEIIKQARKAGVHILLMGRGDFIGSGKLKLRCLHPYEKFETEDRNSASLVLELSYGPFTMVLTGDVDATGEGEMLSHDCFGYQQYSLLKIAHHGSKYSTTEAFLRRVNPKRAIISCGIDNRYGHPHRELLDRLENANVRWTITAQTGAIQMRILREGYTLQGYVNQGKYFSNF